MSTATWTKTPSLTKAELDNTIAIAFQPSTLDRSFDRLLSAHMVMLAITLVEHNVSPRRVIDACSRKAINTEDINLLVHFISLPVETLKRFVPADWFN